MANQWSFATWTFPYEDSPARGESGDWNDDEKLIEHDPLMADVTVLTSWGFRSRRRVITGSCGDDTRDAIRTLHRNRTTGTLTDAEGRAVEARIVRADFSTVLPTAAVAGKRGRYRYTIEFIER